MRPYGGPTMPRLSSALFLALVALGIAACERQPQAEPPVASKDTSLLDSGAVSREMPISPDAPWVAAAARGVTFRAVGNEPGWMLEISPERLRLLTHYGTDSLIARTPERLVAQDTMHYVAHIDTLAVDVEAVRTPCTDMMSGAQYSYTVHVAAGENIYTGCGKPL